MDGYDRRTFEAPLADGAPLVHDVYERGAGAPIVLIQELPGIGQETLRLAERLEQAGHKVVLPHLFGPLGRTAMVGNLVRVLCMRREFSLFTKGASSPVVEWLRLLCRDVCAREGVEGVGVIGMCLTGNFAISLIGDESVLAAVASQPSLPIWPVKGLPMSPAERDASRRRLDTIGPMLAYRFEGDRLCTQAMFDRIDDAFNDGAPRVKLGKLPGRGHSVLTLDFVDEDGHPTHKALDEVLAYFDERLR